MQAPDPYILRLRIVRTDDRWRVSLAERDGRPVEAEIEASLIERRAGQIRTLLDPSGTVAIPGRDAKRTRSEEEAGKLLGGLLSASETLATKMAWHLGIAMGRGQRVALLVDAPEREVRALPWELLAAGADLTPLEPSGVGIVARMTPATTSHPVSDGPLQIALWCVDPDDPSCQAVRDHARAEARSLGLPVHDFDDHVPAGPRLLVIIGHGNRFGEHVEMQLPSGRKLAASSASHVLSGHLEGLPLAVLAVCESGDTTAAEIESLATRLIQGGARACIAPSTRTGVEATQAFNAGLFRGIANGQVLPEAVAAGRRAIRELAMPHPDSRWNNPILYVGDAAVVGARPLIQAGWRPDGWPVPADEAANLLRKAREHAENSGAGFVGLEHLVLALRDTPGGGPATQQYRFALTTVDPVPTWLRNLERVPSRTNWSGTPRLMSLAGALKPGFDLDTLWRTIWVMDGQPLQSLFGMRTAPTPGPGDGTLEATASGGNLHSGPAQMLEVLGGPEDGRRLDFTPGATLGRHSEEGGPSIALYTDMPLIDRYLSRKALTWIGPGEARLARKSRLGRGRRMVPVEPGAVDIRTGDVIALTECTRLVAR